MEQLTLSFEPGISRRYRSLHALCAARVYHAGLDNVARDVDMAPSNLSQALAIREEGEKPGRRFGVEELEKFIEKYQDFEPIFYLVDKFLKDQKAIGKAQLLSRCSSALAELQAQIRAISESQT